MDIHVWIVILMCMKATAHDAQSKGKEHDTSIN